MKYKIILLFSKTVLCSMFLLLLPDQARTQEIVVDRIIAIVGKNMVMESEVEAQYLQEKMQGSIEGSASYIRCQILQKMLRDNLLLNQAELDSIVVSDSDVER